MKFLQFEDPLHSTNHQDTMDDLLDQTNEMQEILGREYGCPEELDDADLDAGDAFRSPFRFSVTHARDCKARVEWPAATRHKRTLGSVVIQ
jgi:hypothetical protein